MNHMLSFTVLGGSIGARHAKVDAIGEEERAGAGVIKLLAVVALNCLDGSAKLSTHIGKEIGLEYVSDLRRKGNVHKW